MIRAILARIDGQLSAGSPEVALTALDAAILAGQVSWLEAERGARTSDRTPEAIAPAITFADVLDVIDMQLLSPLSPEVVLPRDHAQLLAALLTDMLNTRGREQAVKTLALEGKRP